VVVATVVVATATATDPPLGDPAIMAAMTEEGPPTHFARRRHLVFALLALLPLAAVSRAGWRSVEWLGVTPPWDGADMLLFYCIWLIPVAGFAWLAFVAFDTHAGVSLARPNWWRVGLGPVAVLVIMVAWYMLVLLFGTSKTIAESAYMYWPYYDHVLGRVTWGWVVASTLVAVLTEELAFRGLLQRALEGYMSEREANVVQAFVFELVHLYVYGLPFLWGNYFISGLAFGAAFGRTRSLLGPVVLHFTGNIIHALVFASTLKSG
jgi:membrane protease YdiL (CAAX protease family)